MNKKWPGKPEYGGEKGERKGEKRPRRPRLFYGHDMESRLTRYVLNCYA